MSGKKGEAYTFFVLNYSNDEDLAASGAKMELFRHGHRPVTVQVAAPRPGRTASTCADPNTRQ